MLILSRCNTHKHAVDRILTGEIFKVTRQPVCRLYVCTLPSRLRPNLGGPKCDVEQMEVGKMRVAGVYTSSFCMQHVCSARNLQPVVT